MNFEQLLYAEILAQHNSMQKAADVLHISKSGLSIAIGQLESELGVTLFDKSASGTKLTSQGRQLLSTISDVLQLKNNLETMATSMANPQKHQWVRIHYMNTMLKLFITPFINHYFNKFQNIQLDINCHEFDSIVQSLLNGKIDAGFVAINNTHDEVIKALKFTPVFESKLALFCSPNNFLTTLKRPITLDDIKTTKLRGVYETRRSPYTPLLLYSGSEAQAVVAFLALRSRI